MKGSTGELSFLYQESKSCRRRRGSDVVSPIPSIWPNVTSKAAAPTQIQRKHPCIKTNPPSWHFRPPKHMRYMPFRSWKRQKKTHMIIFGFISKNSRQCKKCPAVHWKENKLDYTSTTPIVRLITPRHFDTHSYTPPLERLVRLNQKISSAVENRLCSKVTNHSLYRKLFMWI